MVAHQVAARGVTQRTVAPPPTTERLRHLVREAAESFAELSTPDLRPLVRRIGEARLVLIGEASHGTSEFYRMRARLERAIGVIYRPDTEFQSHYFQARLPNQFDEYIWFDETRAVRPLGEGGRAPELPHAHPFATIAE